MSLRNLIRQAGNALAGPDAIERWIDAGRPSPPPAEMKARNVVVLAELFGLRTFVETGTYTGDMLAAVAAHFDRLYSIELDKRLASAAVAKFAGNQKITVFQGESADRLSALLPTLPAACCFWLDAHCSGAGTALGRNYTPIVEELNILARRAGADLIIIDDARLFGSDQNYPSRESIGHTIRQKFGAGPVFGLDAIVIFPRR